MVSERINKGDLVSFCQKGNDRRALVMDIEEIHETGILIRPKKIGCKVTFAVLNDSVLQSVFFDLDGMPFFIGIDGKKQELDLRIDFLF